VSSARADNLARSATVLDPPELIRRLPSPLTREDEPLVRRVLAELQRRPLDAAAAAGVHERASDLSDFAVRHGLGPLDGLNALIDNREVPVARRIRLARALGQDDQARTLATQRTNLPAPGAWIGTCGTTDLCSTVTATIEAARAIRLSLDVVQTDEVDPYVEIYVDDVRVAEGNVRGSRTFALPVREAGSHRVEVRLANPQTRNGVQRRVRLS
jgi:hypothetical protein